MKCFACDGGLPTNNNNNYDPPTGRFYCDSCGEEIKTLYQEMFPPEQKGFEVLEEDFDIQEDICFVQTEENYQEFSLPPENYDE